MTARLNLPVPPNQYDPETENKRNAEIERILNLKLGSDQLPVFSGVPFAVLKGSNAAFSVANGATPVVVAFDTSVKRTDKLIKQVGNTIVPSVTSDFRFSFRLRHTAAAGGNVNYTVGAFVNGVVTNSHIFEAVSVNDTYDLSADLMVLDAPLNSVIDLRVNHNFASPVLFDLTLSNWRLQRLSPNPNFVPRIV